MHKQPTRRPRSNRRTHRGVNYLPKHQALAFEQELETLVSSLSKTEGFKGAYLKSEYKSKYLDNSVVPSDDRRTSAILKWQKCEKRNARTNAHLMFQEDSPFYDESLETKVKEIISQVLGPLVYPQVLSTGCFTNGASTRVKRSAIAAFQKHTGVAHVSSTAIKHWLAVASGTLLNEVGDYVVQEGSVLFTVPKKSDIDRVACKEPEINMFLQKSVGNHIRNRLRRFSIDLNDQTVNQTLARDALHLGLATIDLSAASDSITRQLVYNLLPFEWWSLLDDLRVHTTCIDGSEHHLEMFSSMGNGFTFELESLIFYAIARAVAWKTGTKGKISVYGDDIIVPSRMAVPLVRRLAHYGFLVNTKKSHWTGPFRESCGKHYHDSREVTPFYLREPVKFKTDVIRILNRLLIWDSCGLGCITHSLILSFHKKWAQSIPSCLHGGVDPEMPYALVTGDRPRKMLIPKTSRMKYDQLGAYLYWHNARRLMRSEDVIRPDQFSDPRRIIGFSIAKNSTFQVSTTWDPYLMDRTQ